MAVITRTAWTDDDGTGTTGTVINNAWKTELYNQIDALIASFLTAAGVLGPVTAIEATAAGGLTLRATHASGPLIFGAGGAAERARLTPGGAMRSLGGSIPSVSGTPVTLFAVQAGGVSTYLVSVGIGNNSNDGPNYASFAIVQVEGNSGIRLVQAFNATTTSISLSGLNVQGTQSSGAPVNLIWRAFRIGDEVQ